MAKALREIRNKENEYKEKALRLREHLRKEEKYTWKGVAKHFLDSVRKQFEDDMENVTTPFLRAEQITRLNPIVNGDVRNNVPVELPAEKRIVLVQGKNALPSLYWALRAKYNKYSILFYDIPSGQDDASIYTDFIDACRSFFGSITFFVG